MAASVYSFSAVRYAIVSGFSLESSHAYSSTTVSPWCVRSLGTFFATGGCCVVTPQTLPVTAVIPVATALSRT